ncbi:hypothetical protein L4X63_01775 [Geomonas sp. Red32]|uniref:hypothetical protein n=1 Tax=Geomonas sp. Red32 TaxID=2912856 RepID=UPI00202CDFC0|nr:hypothetical protein [Geomonas sp. Red32]MCM0080308.1 hypothetical protein [Geomonas sp. Red32]
MDQAALIDKIRTILTPFETENMVRSLKTLTVKSAISNPWFVGIFLIVAFYAVVVRSKFVLSLLFASASILILIRYTMPAEGDSLSVSSTLPFAFGALAIGAVLIYLFFIKSE